MAEMEGSRMSEVIELIRDAWRNFRRGNERKHKTFQTNEKYKQAELGPRIHDKKWWEAKMWYLNSM